MNDTEDASGVSAPRSQRRLERQFRKKQMQAIFSDHGRLQGVFDFEAGLGRAEAASIRSAGTCARSSLPMSA